VAKTIDIVVPDLGDFDNVEVIDVIVGAGDTVEREDGLVTIETDKATMDIPSPENGVIDKLTIRIGDTVSTGDVIGQLTMEVGDTVVIAPAIASVPTGDTTLISALENKKQKSRGKQTLVVPDLGDFSDVQIIEVHIKAGDTVAVEDSLVTLETDKAAMDVPAVVAGSIESVLVNVGETVSEGTALAIIDVAASEAPVDAGTSSDAEPASKEVESRPSSPPANVPAKPAPTGGSASLPPVDEAFTKAHATPSVRKLARELGVNLVQVKGSGLKNRILHDDVKAFVKAILTGKTAGPAGAALPKTPVVDFAKFGEIDVQPLTRIQKISGPRLQASWINLPHVTQHDLADITELEAKRQELKGPAKDRGIGLTPLAFIMKACVAALTEYPMVNSSLAQELGELSALARDGRLKAGQLQGACFTVSSLGGIGGTAFTPIVNAPEVAILGVSRSTMQPVWNGSEFEPRLMLPLSFSYDHRVIDGAQAVRFTTFLGQKLADVETLLQAIP